MRQALLLKPGGICPGTSTNYGAHKLVLLKRRTLRPRFQKCLADASNNSVSVIDRLNSTTPSSSAENDKDNTPQPKAPKGPFLSDPRSQEVAFGGLSVISTLLGVGAVFSPALMCYLVLGGGGTAPELELIYARIAGLTLAVSAFSEASLADAAANNRLSSVTYQRLMMACIGKSILYMGTLVLHPGLCNPTLLALFLSTNSAAIGIHYNIYKQTNNDQGPPFGWTDPKTTPAIVYTIIGALYVITAGSCLLPPSSTAMVFAGKITLQSSFLQHLWIPGYLLAAALCFVLKDAADRDRLAGGTFRRLNLAICILELGFSIQLGTAMAGGLAPLNTANYVNLAVSQLIAAYTGWHWRFATKPEDRRPKLLK